MVYGGNHKFKKEVGYEESRNGMSEFSALRFVISKYCLLLWFSKGVVFRSPSIGDPPVRSNPTSEQASTYVLFSSSASPLLFPRLYKHDSLADIIHHRCSLFIEADSLLVTSNPGRFPRSGIRTRPLQRLDTSTPIHMASGMLSNQHCLVSLF